MRFFVVLTLSTMLSTISYCQLLNDLIKQKDFVVAFDSLLRSEKRFEITDDGWPIIDSKIQIVIDTFTFFRYPRLRDQYAADSNFRAVINNITYSTHTRQQYFTDSGSIKTLIRNLPDMATRAYTLYYLSDQYLPLQDEVIQNDMQSLYQKTIPSFASWEIALDQFSLLGVLAEANADYGTHLGLYKYAMKNYLYASYVYDSLKNHRAAAIIENKIARLYLYHTNPSSADQISYHFRNASNHFLLTGDTLQSIVSTISAIQSEIQNTSNDIFSSLENYDGTSFSDLISDPILIFRNMAENIDLIKYYKPLHELNDYISTINSYSEWWECNPSFSNLTGRYFLIKKDLSNSIACFETCLRTLLLTKREMDIDELYESLSQLGYAYSLHSDTLKCLHVLNLAKDISAAFWGIEGRASYQRLSGIYYSNLGFDSLSISHLDSSLSIIDSLTISDDAKSFWRAPVFQYLSKDYQQINLPNLAQTASTAYLDANATGMSNAAHLAETDYDYIESMAYEKTDRLLGLQKKLMASINKLQSEQNSLNAAIMRMRVDSLKSSYLLASLITRRDSLTIENDTLQNRIVLAKRELDKKKKDIKSLNSWLTISVSSLFGALGVVTFILFLNDRRARRKRRILTELAVNQIHNTKGNYADALDLVKQARYPTAIDFLSASVLYYEQSSDRVIAKKGLWTIADELAVAKVYVDKEKVQRPEIDLKISASESIYHFSFIPEVLTTLIHNSIRWGFKHKTKDCQIEVSIIKRGRYLFFEVHDNGVLVEQPSPEKKVRNNSGTTMIRGRLRIEFGGLHFLKKKIYKRVSSENGTTVYFNYPCKTLGR